MIPLKFRIMIFLEDWNRTPFLEGLNRSPFLEDWEGKDSHVKQLPQEKEM